MRSLISLSLYTVCLLFLPLSQGAHAQSENACSSYAIIAKADVDVSDGKEYALDAYFQSTKSAAIEITEGAQSTKLALEGPFSWRRADGEDQIADRKTGMFILGHQFHAFLLNFEHIATETAQFTDVLFDGQPHTGTVGYIGDDAIVRLFDGDDKNPYAGLRFELSDDTVVDVIFSDWKEKRGQRLPYKMRIDDQERIFEYSFKKVEVTEKSPDWLFKAFAAPQLDAVQISRLHRNLLIAHCEGDAKMMGALTAPDILVASRGDLIASSSEETSQRFDSVFSNVDYTGYFDLKDPVIEVSENGDIGWAGVNTRAVGLDKETGEEFDMQWAWIMLAKKIDGVWLNAGNASNMKQP